MQLEIFLFSLVPYGLINFRLKKILNLICQSLYFDLAEQQVQQPVEQVVHERAEPIQQTLPIHQIPQQVQYSQPIQASPSPKSVGVADGRTAVCPAAHMGSIHREGAGAQEGARGRPASAAENG